MDDGTSALLVFVFIGGLILFPILCGILADDKGRRAGTWAVLGFLGGPFALLFLAMLSNLKLMPGWNAITEKSPIPIQPERVEELIKHEALS